MINIEIINKITNRKVLSEFVTLLTYKEGEISIFPGHKTYKGNGYRIKFNEEIIDTNYLFYINNNVLKIFCY
ncbi:hypothetical protein AB836_00070 [Rickettsiales bacterium (ex Bugula neritina AB1)]|nr:hypothetical protein AB836_00070 [Rickettsiales bacterium (ex Bugula neritina AB1)]